MLGLECLGCFKVKKQMCNTQFIVISLIIIITGAEMLSGTAVLDDVMRGSVSLLKQGRRDQTAGTELGKFG